MFKTYIINLESSDSRLKAMTDHLNTLGLPFERVAAIDGRKLDVSSFAEYDPVSTQRRHGRVMSGGELGCYLSHITALKSFAESEFENALICEDDIILPSDAKHFLSSFLELSKCESLTWDLLFLGSPLTSRIFAPVYAGCGHEVFRSIHLPITATAILWSKQGAKSFLNSKYSKTIQGPVDYAIRSFSSFRGQSLGLGSSFICLQGAPSDIGDRMRLGSRGELKVDQKIKIIIYRKAVDKINEVRSFLRGCLQR